LYDIRQIEVEEEEKFLEGELKFDGMIGKIESLVMMK